MVPDDLAGLRKLYLGFVSSRVILTANNLKIFDNLKKASSATEIAEKLNIDPRATEIVLDALTGIGLVSKSRTGRYRNTPVEQSLSGKRGPPLPGRYHQTCFHHVAELFCFG